MTGQPLHAIVAALNIALLLAIYWYFWSDPDRRQKDLKDAFDRFGGVPPASA